MTVGLDARMATFSGIGTTIRGLLDHWTPAQLAQVTLFAPPTWKSHYPCRVEPAPEKVYGLAQHVSYARRLNVQKMDLFHMPHFDVPYLFRGRLVVTIHDLIHIHFPQHSTKPFSRLYASAQIRRAVRRAAQVIAVSEHTREDLERFIPGSSAKTTVLHPAASAAFRPLDDAAVRPVLERHGLTRGYFLYVGNLRGTKNTLTLIAAYQRLRAASPNVPPLVLVGHNSYRQFDGGFPAGIRHLAGVPFEDLPALYNGASLFVFPSLYEGFGLPPLEAMSCGTPVISSNAASLPEVCGDAAVYVDPASEVSLADAMGDLWASPSRRAELSVRGRARAQKFSWDAFAQGTWKVYERALS